MCLNDLAMILFSSEKLSVPSLSESKMRMLRSKHSENREERKVFVLEFLNFFNQLPSSVSICFKQ